MDPSVRVTYHRVPENRFYMCLYCGSSLVIFNNVISWSREANNIFCQHPVNVRLGVDEGLSQVVLMQGVHCNGCGRELGGRINSINEREPTATIREGNYMFYINMLAFWDGHQAVDALTLEPI